MDRRLKMLLCMIFVFIGSVFAFGVPGIINTITSKYTIETEAVIVDYTSNYDDGSEMYSAVFEYTVDGTQYREESNTQTSWQPKLGESKTIKVDPNNPSDFIEPKVLSVITMIFKIVGYVFLVVFVIILLIRSKKTIGY